jgi:hypothetical protein
MAEEDDQKDHGSTDDRKGPKTEGGRRFWLIGGLVVLFVSVGLIYLGYWIFFARFNVGTVAWARPFDTCNRPGRAPGQGA